MKTIKTLIFTAIACFMMASLSAQTSHGTVEYDIKMETDNDEMKMAISMMSGSTMKITFNETSSRTDMSMGGMMTNSNITNKEEMKTMYLVEIPMMGQKSAAISDIEENEEAEGEDDVSPEITYHDETKEILGYTCKKVTVIIEDEDNFVETVLYVTDEIVAKEYETAGSAEINGFPLEMVVSTETPEGTMTMTFEASDVDTKKPDAELFEIEIPEGYEESSMEEIKAMGAPMGG